MTFCNMRTFEEYAQSGAKLDVMTALALLTKAYVAECGISLGNRTVVYCAAEVWQLKLAFMDLPLSEMARKLYLFELMPHLCSDYIPEVHDDYDIAGLSNAELREYCEEILKDKELDEATNEALCWGIAEVCKDEKFIPEPVSTIADDGTPLHGQLTQQDLSGTYITMEQPYLLQGGKLELVLNPELILQQMYNEYQRLMSQEDEIRKLYEEYKIRYLQLDHNKKRQKYGLFYEVYEPLIGDTCLLSPQELFHQCFGLEFYDVDHHKDPSWVIHS